MKTVFKENENVIIIIHETTLLYSLQYILWKALQLNLIKIKVFLSHQLINIALAKWIYHIITV